MKLSKTYALLMMALLVFSAVPVLADEHGSGESSDDSDQDGAIGAGEGAGSEDLFIRPIRPPKHLGKRSGRTNWFGGIPDKAKDLRQDRAKRFEQFGERFPGQADELRVCVEQCFEDSTRDTSDSKGEAGKYRAACQKKCAEIVRGELKADREEFEEKFKELREDRKEALKNMPKIINIKKEFKKASEDGKLSKDDRIKLIEMKNERAEMLDKYQEEKMKLLDLRVEKFKTPRVIAHAEIVKINRAMDRAREHYRDARKGHLESRKELESVKDEYRACFKKAETVTGEDGRAEEVARCKGVSVEFTGYVKEYLLQTSELVLEALNKLKYQIKSSEHIDEEKANAMLEDIEARIAKVKDAQDVVEKLDESANKAELKEAAATIRNAWKGTRTMFKKKVGTLMNAKLGNIIHQMEKLEEKFTKARDKLKERGADVVDLDEALDKFDEQLSSAKENYEKAVALFKEAQENDEVSDVTEVTDATKEAHELLKEARTHLRDAKQDLRSIVKEIRAQVKELRKAAAELSETADTAEQIEAVEEEN